MIGRMMGDDEMDKDTQQQIDYALPRCGVLVETVQDLIDVLMRIPPETRVATDWGDDGVVQWVNKGRADQYIGITEAEDCDEYITIR